MIGNRFLQPLSAARKIQSGLRFQNVQKRRKMARTAETEGILRISRPAEQEETADLRDEAFVYFFANTLASQTT